MTPISTDRTVARTPARKPTSEDAAGADEDLGEDVLAGLGGAEPVGAGRRLEQVVAHRVGVVRGEPRARRRRATTKNAEDQQPGAGLAAAQEAEPGSAGRRGAGTSVGTATSVAVTDMASGLLPGAGVEEDVDHVGEEVRRRARTSVMIRKTPCISG